MINCDSQEEIDYYWESLPRMAARRCSAAGSRIKYGLSWQVVPTKFFDEWVKDPAGLQRVMHELMQMKKLDLAKLEAAYQG